MTILEELKKEAAVLKAVTALGEEDEALHYCCMVKQLSTGRKKRRVAVGLTYLALYVFDMESTGPKYLQCMHRIRTVQLSCICRGKGGLVRKAFGGPPMIAPGCPAHYFVFVVPLLRLSVSAASTTWTPLW